MDVRLIAATTLAFVLRAVYLLEIRGAPMYSLLAGDASAYDAWARRLAGGDWLGREVFYQAPLYPYFLGVIYAVRGADVDFVRWVQVVLGSLSCLALGLAGRAWFSLRVGAVAAFLLAVYPSAIFFDGLIQKPVLDLFLLSCLLYVLGRTQRRPTVSGWLVAGALVGFLSLSRENALFLLAIVLVWSLLGFRQSSPVHRLRWAASLVLGAMLVLGPVAARNWVVGGELHVTTSQLGPNFYMGNNPAADGTYQPLRPGREVPEFEREDATELAERALGRTLSPGEVSRYWLGQGLAFIFSEPGRWLRLMLRKWLLVWNALEWADIEDQYSYAESSRLLRVLTALFHFGVLCPIAAFGICATRRRWRRLWVLYAILVGYAASVALFYVFARYRFPIVPVLALFAAAGLAEVPRAVRAGRWTSLWPCALGALAAAVVSNRTLLGENAVPMMRARTHYNIGNALYKRDRFSEAIGEYEAGLRLNPADPQTHGNLASALVELGHLEQAIAHYQTAVRLRPDALFHYDLGTVLAFQGRDAEAIAHFEAALRLDPAHAHAHNNLGSVLSRAGRNAEALEHYRQATRLRPDVALFQRNFAAALAAQGPPEGSDK